MVKTAERLRAELATAERSGSGRPYPLALRREAVAYVEARRKQGVGCVAAARELGVSAFSVGRWRASLSAALAPVFRPVVLAEPLELGSESGSSALVVHGPAGLRIEGLDLAAVAELWRRLL
jgi:transposase